MRLVLSRFHNEAYLMCWWLRHHREIFDHGILIDSNSTDETADICRTLVPGWEIIKTEYREFSSIMADFEIMKQEARFPGAWKIALNTTEFLVSPSLSALEASIEQKSCSGTMLPGAIMVDTEPELRPDPALPLIDQKANGVWEEGFDFTGAAIPGLKGPGRGRLYHCYDIGAYSPGRHRSFLPGLTTARREEGAIWWYGFCPWTEELKSRKRQFADSFSSFDKRYGFGIQHYADLDTLEERWSRLRALSRPLAAITSEISQLRPEIGRLTGEVAARDKSLERQAALLRLSAYDFVDFGCSKGGSIDFAQKRFGGRGIGIDIDATKVAKALAAGYDAVQGDVSELDPRQTGKTRFAILSHFLQHLPTFAVAKKCIVSACLVSREFVLIQQPYFDADPYLFNHRLKLYWSDWRAHRLPMTTFQLYRIVVPLIARAIIKRAIIGCRSPIFNSSAPEIHSIHSPEGSFSWERGTHPVKTDLHFSFPVYRETCAVLLIGSNNLTKELQTYIDHLEIIWDSAKEEQMP